MAIHSPNINTLINSINSKRNANSNATGAKIANISADREEAQYRYNKIATAENITTNLANLTGNMYQKTDTYLKNKDIEKQNKIVEDGRAREKAEKIKADAVAEAEKKEYQEGAIGVNQALTELANISNINSIAQGEMTFTTGEDGGEYFFGKSFTAKYENIIKDINNSEYDDNVKTLLIDAVDESVADMKNSMITAYGEKIYNENKALEYVKFQTAIKQDIANNNFTSPKETLELVSSSEYLSDVEKLKLSQEYTDEINVGVAKKFYKNLIKTEGSDSVYVSIMENDLIPDGQKSFVYNYAENVLQAETIKAKETVTKNLEEMYNNDDFTISFGGASLPVPFQKTGSSKILSPAITIEGAVKAFEDAAPEIKAAARATAVSAINKQISDAGIYKTDSELNSMLAFQVTEYSKNLEKFDKLGGTFTTKESYYKTMDSVSEIKTNFALAEIENAKTNLKNQEDTIEKSYEEKEEYLTDQRSAVVAGSITAEEYIKNLNAFKLLNNGDDDITNAINSALGELTTLDGKNPLIPTVIRNNVVDYMKEKDKVIDDFYGDDTETASSVKTYYKTKLFNSFYNERGNTSLEPSVMFSDTKSEIDLLISAKEYDNLDKILTNRQFYKTNNLSMGIIYNEITGEKITITPEVEKVYNENEIFLKNVLERTLGPDYKISSNPSVPKVGADGKSYAVPSIKVFDKNGNSTYYSMDSKGKILKLNEKWDSWITTDIQGITISDSNQAIIDRYNPKNAKPEFKVDPNSDVHPIAQKMNYYYKQGDYYKGNLEKIKKTVKLFNKKTKSTGVEVPEELNKGNIDLSIDRKQLKNKDGSISTMSTASFNFDGKEVLLPTVIDGVRLSNEEAIKHYEKTGENFGVFNTVKEADEYAKKLHEFEEEKLKKDK